jgi:hypothetical protein
VYQDIGPDVEAAFPNVDAYYASSAASYTGTLCPPINFATPNSSYSKPYNDTAYNRTAPPLPNLQVGKHVRSTPKGELPEWQSESPWCSLKAHGRRKWSLKAHGATCLSVCAGYKQLHGAHHRLAENPRQRTDDILAVQRRRLCGVPRRQPPH